MRVKLVVLSKGGRIKSESFHDRYVEFYTPALLPDEWAQVWVDLGGLDEGGELWELVAILKR